MTRGECIQRFPVLICSSGPKTLRRQPKRFADGTADDTYHHGPDLRIDRDGRPGTKGLGDSIRIDLAGDAKERAALTGAIEPAAGSGSVAELRFRGKIWQASTSLLLNGRTGHPAHIMLNPFAC